MKIAIVILHFGELKTTQACVESILRFEKNFLSIFVVNNDRAQLKKNDFGTSSKIAVINNKENVGFAAGVNIGIKKALRKNADAIFLLNNDTRLSRPLLPVLEKDLTANKQIGLISPALEFTQHTKLFDMGGYINMIIGRTHHKNEKKIPTKSLQFPDYISGCSMLIRKEVFEKIGYFDERFFLYYEDVDFCLRAEKAGWQVALDPRIILHHGLSKSVGKGSKVSMYHQTRSALLFGRKYFGNGWRRIINILFVFVQSCLFFKNNPQNGIFAFRAMKEIL